MYIKIRRGVRQGDTISSKLFTAARESTFRRLIWETRGLKIDIIDSHLRFADDILICANTPHELQQMLANESETQGRKINMSKTKVIMENDMPIYVSNTQIVNVESYIYLGQRYSTRDKNQNKEIQRRITAGWTAFVKHRYIFKGNTGACLKRQVYNTCVHPAMTYGAKTRALTTQTKNKLAAAQTKMERNMLNITYQDRKTSIWVREVRRRKWTWAGLVSKIRDNRWTLRITRWKPYERRRPRGRPVRRTTRLLEGTIWQRIVQDRQMWSMLRPSSNHRTLAVQ